MEWISIEKERPLEDCVCLAANTKTESGYHLVAYHKGVNSFYHYRSANFIMNGLPVEVTHWTPLPEMPSNNTLSEETL